MQFLLFFLGPVVFVDLKNAAVTAAAAAANKHLMGMFKKKPLPMYFWYL
jgi:hypothetical protein